MVTIKWKPKNIWFRIKALWFSNQQSLSFVSTFYLKNNTRFKNQCGGVLSRTSSTYPLKNSHTAAAQYWVRLHDKGQGKLEWADCLTGQSNHRWSNLIPMPFRSDGMCNPLHHSPWSMSLNEFQFLSFKIKLINVLHLLCMLPVVGLHMFYSLLIILMLVNKYL